MKDAKTKFALAIAIAIVVGSIAPAPGVAADEPATATKTYPGDETEGKRLFGLGQEAFLAGKVEEALQLFRQAYGVHQHPVFAYNEGLALRLTTRCDEAVPAYLRYLDQIPSPDPVVYIGLGECYHRLNKTEEAKKYLNKYLQTATDDEEKKKVQQSIETGKPPSELEQSDPGKQAAKKLYARAAALFEELEYLAAAKLFIEAFGLYDSPDLLYDAALSYFNAVEYAQASDYLVRYLQYNQVNPKAWILLGDCYYWTGDHHGARQAYLGYLEVAPDGPHAQRASESLLYLPVGDVGGQGGPQ